MKTTYKDAGVDILKAEKFVSFIRKKTSLDSMFGGLFPLKNCQKNSFLVSSADGVGTKLKIAFDSGIHDTVGIDLVAMNVNDILCRGAKPLFFLDYIAVGKIELQVLKEVLSGIVAGCDQAGCSLIGGETAEMPDFYKPGEYDLSGFCVGIVEKKKVLPKTKKIKKGDLVIGIASSGLHSNGFSLVRKVFSKKELVKRAKEFLTPTRIYVGPILKLLEDLQVKQIAHITGGGFFLKAVKGLPPSLGIKIYRQNWELPFIFKEIQQRAKLTDEEMFSTFNMGIGLTVIVSPRYVNKVCDFLSKYWPVWIIGQVIERKGVILG